MLRLSSRKNISKVKVKELLNPYFVALLTASLAGLFSIIGGYFVSGFQAKNTTEQKQLEFKVSAYTLFLDKTDENKSPVINQILNIGLTAENLATDSEIQAFENRLGTFLEKNDTQDLYWQLNSDLNILRLHGSARVTVICDDLLKALLLREHEIDWSFYPKDVISSHDAWKNLQAHGQAYGWEEKITPDERLMFISIAKLMNVLVLQLRNEMQRT